MQPDGQLLANLTEIAPQGLGLVPVSRRLKRLVEREPGLARQAELLEGAVDQRLLGGLGVHVRLHFGQAVGDEQDAVDQHAVRGTLDLKVAEERVGAEQREGLVETVVRLRVGVHVEGVGARGQLGERECWAASLGAQWEEGEVSCVGGREGTSVARVRGSIISKALSVVNIPIVWTPWSPRKIEWYA